MKFEKTQTIRSAYYRYIRSPYSSNLYECYANPSAAKRDAMDYCLRLCRDLNGTDLRIIGYNCMVFSVGFVFTDENGRKCFAYITRDYDRYMYIS